MTQNQREVTKVAFCHFFSVLVLTHSLEAIFVTVDTTVELLHFLLFPFQLSFRKKGKDNILAQKYVRNPLMEEKSPVGMPEPT